MTEIETNTTAPTQGQSKNLDFTKIEDLRKYMGLTVDSLVALFGVSRVAYYSWLKDTPSKPRKTTETKIRRVVRGLLTLVSANQWPTKETFLATQADRLEMLREALENLDKSAV